MEIHIVEIGENVEVIEVRSAELRLVKERLWYLACAGYPTSEPVLEAGEWKATVPVTRPAPEAAASQA